MLVSGGIAAFSVFGDPNRCTLYASINASEEKVMEFVPTRQVFHLNSKERLEEIMREAGFGRTLFFEEDCQLSLDLEETMD